MCGKEEARCRRLLEVYLLNSPPELDTTLLWRCCNPSVEAEHVVSTVSRKAHHRCREQWMGETERRKPHEMWHVKEGEPMKMNEEEKKKGDVAGWLAAFDGLEVSGEQNASARFV